MKYIPLYWFSTRILKGETYENFGDLLSKELIEKISNKKVEWTDPSKKNWGLFYPKVFFAVGSILHFATKSSIVWGSGIIDKKLPVQRATFHAVRGPQTYKRLKALGYKVGCCFGDPGLLCSKYFPKKKSKKYSLGIIPHYLEFEQFKASFNSPSNEVVLIDLKDSPQKVIDLILECDKIVSSSLHGIIIPHSYGIPALKFRYSDKIYGDGVKYQDYFESVGIPSYQVPLYSPEKFSMKEVFSYLQHNQSESLIKKDLEKIQADLISTIPF